MEKVIYIGYHKKIMMMIIIIIRTVDKSIPMLFWNYVSHQLSLRSNIGHVRYHPDRTILATAK